MQDKKLPVRLDHGLPAAEVGDRLRQAADSLGLSRRILAFYLTDMEQRRLYMVSGHASTTHFAETQLDLDARRTREYLQVGRALQGLELVDQALLAGEISWSRTVALLPVVQRDSQRAWVDFARAQSYRDLRAEVGACRPGDLPGGGDGYGLIRKSLVIQARLDDSSYAMFERVRMLLSNEDEDLLNDADVILAMMRRILQEETSGPTTGTEDRGGEPVQPPAEPNTEELPEELRLRVQKRDHHACRNCHSQFDVHVHHLVSRQTGGSNGSSNLICLCNTCHTLIHRGFLRVHGNPDVGQLEFTSGDGDPVNRRRASRAGGRTPDGEEPSGPPRTPQKDLPKDSSVNGDRDSPGVASPPNRTRLDAGAL